jgi:hypothetical protein
MLGALLVSLPPNRQASHLHLARDAVDEAARARPAARPPRDHARELLDERLAALLLEDGVLEVGAVEGGGEHEAGGEAELARDVELHARRRRRGEREERERGELLLEVAEFRVGGAEVVAPRGDAVRLVDHDARLRGGGWAEGGEGR